MTDDTTENYHGGNRRSRAARARTDTERDRTRVYEHVWQQRMRGANAYEASVALGMLHQTCSARFTDLRSSHDIIPMDYDRPTGTGSDGEVCVARVHLPSDEAARLIALADAARHKRHDIIERAWRLWQRMTEAQRNELCDRIEKED